jgi:hypothetical protein
MSSPFVRRRLGRLLTTSLTALLTGAALAAPASAVTPDPPAAQAPLPTQYSGAAHGDIVNLDADLANGDLADLVVGHSAVAADTQASPRVKSTSANLGLALGGAGGALDELVATAPPPSDPPERTLLPLDLSPLANVQAIRGKVSANYVSDTQCVPSTNGLRLLGAARTRLAGLTVLGVPPLTGALLDAKASETRSGTALVDQPNGGSAVVSNTETTLGDVSLLGGAAVVHVTQPVRITATSNGTTGTVAVTDYLVQVILGNGRILDIPVGDGPVHIPIALNPLVDLNVEAFDAEKVINGAKASGSLDAVVAIDLKVLQLG